MLVELKVVVIGDFFRKSTIRNVITWKKTVQDISFIQKKKQRCFFFYNKQQI